MTETAVDGRSARKRAAILEAAAEAFLSKGYLGTSMDEIAATASVSKQTVYKHFSDKETLFTEIVGAAGARADDVVAGVTARLADTRDVAADLGGLARALVRAVIDPEILRLRRLVIAEAGRFPELGRRYWDGAFDRVISTLAEALRRLDERGLLTVADPRGAAGHFAGLLLWIPANQAMFTGVDEPPPAAEIDRLAAEAVRVFLAAYGRR